MPDKYIVTTQTAEQFTSVLLMDYMISRQGDLPILMDGSYRCLEPLVIRLKAAGYLRTPAQTEKGTSYLPTDQGREALAKFMQRYDEYLKVYDVFCAVDLSAGLFAFSRFYDFDSDAAWDAYLAQPNWEDLRVAVAEFKKIDPLEIVFMSFLNENRFDYTTTTWQFDISSGLIWERMEQICNAALSVDQVNQGDETVMPDIISQGAQLTVALLQKEAELNKSGDAPAAQLDTAAQAYQPNAQPSYSSPGWLGRLFSL